MIELNFTDDQLNMLRDILIFAEDNGFKESFDQPIEFETFEKLWEIIIA